MSHGPGGSHVRPGLKLASLGCHGRSPSGVLAFNSRVLRHKQIAWLKWAEISICFPTAHCFRLRQQGWVQGKPMQLGVATHTHTHMTTTAFSAMDRRPPE